MSGTNIYVGNISYDMTESEIRDLFAPFGSVTSVNVITDRDSGRPKGFAFVEMDSPESAQKAIDGLNGVDAKGRKLNVNEARPRTSKPRENRRW